MKVRVVRSIHEVEPETWDRLGPDAVFGHAWFRALEASRVVDCDPRHLVIEDGGRVRGVLPCFVQRGDPYQTLMKRLAGPAARWLPRQALVAYSPLAQRSEILLEPQVSMTRAVRACREAMDQICAEEGIGISGWLFVRSDDAPLGRALHDAGYLAGFLAPSARWNNAPFDSFDAYVERFKRVSRRRYKDVRYELNRFRRSGIELREDALSSLSDELLARMQDQHYARHNPGSRSPFDAVFFAALKRELGGRALVHTARSAGGEVLSYSIVLAAEKRWHMFLSGDRDPESAHQDKLHFNLNFYFPIQRAIECAVSHLEYGLSTYEAKLQRGCALAGVGFWVRAHTPLLRAALPGWVRAVDQWYRRKHRALPLDAWSADSRVTAQPDAWKIAS